MLVPRGEGVFSFAACPARTWKNRGSHVLHIRGELFSSGGLMTTPYARHASHRVRSTYVGTQRRGTRTAGRRAAKVRADLGLVTKTCSARNREFPTAARGGMVGFDVSSAFNQCRCTFDGDTGCWRGGMCGKHGGIPGHLEGKLIGLRLAAVVMVL